MHKSLTPLQLHTQDLYFCFVLYWQSVWMEHCLVTTFILDLDLGQIVGSFNWRYVKEYPSVLTSSLNKKLKILSRFYNFLKFENLYATVIIYRHAIISYTSEYLSTCLAFLYLTAGRRMV